MSILLGNLTIKEIEKRVDVTFPDELVEYMTERHQPNADNIKEGKWHCFDIPFHLVCGDRETAMEIVKYLSPLGKSFKTQLPISLGSRK